MPIIGYSVCVVLYLFRGTPGLHSIIGVQLCSKTYWILFFIPIIVTIFLTYYQSRMIINDYNRRVAINYPFCESDIFWEGAYLWLMPVLGLFVGLLSTSIGIGGGTLIGPIFVSLINNPLVAAASSNAIVVFTSSSSTIQFAIMGKLDFKYSIYCLAATIIGSFLGSLIMNFVIRKTGRASYVIISLAIVCGLSTIAIPINTLYDLNKRHIRGFSLFEMGSICDANNLNFH